METIEELRLKLTEAQEECRQLKAENEELRRKLGLSPQLAGACLPGGIFSSSSETTKSTDRLIIELQRRLWDALQRNSFLEQESHAGHSALIQTYEGFIERLEKELHRCQELLRQQTSDSPPAKKPGGEIG
ncbi:hypothetical protein TcG_00774 [Trypanosoma cruzi]|nr:hypothetical protein TcBrA4_0008580 [Trypanosoma cruzi]PBJ79793.1 hypothetical protein BCY84_02210 [Trypanosoma cruzi cruzi]RNF24609.1 hypothetical protein TcG_00774 [Trypanosoma cruzi]